MTDLSDDDLAAFRTRLHTLRDELNALLTDARAATVELDQAAMGRVSRGDALQQQAMAQAERRRAEVRLLQIARALRALDEDDYGACTRCGETIARKRLEARPETPFCLACATALGT